MIVSPSKEVQDHYDLCIRQGTSPTLALMFAEGRGPSIKTDATFLQGQWNQFEKTAWLGDRYKKVADEAGVDITGKLYLSQLAAYPGDPRAWVSGRGDVQRVCEERGWGCSGDVSVKAQEPISEPASIGIADDIVDRKVGEILATVEAPEQVDVQDLREQVKDKISPPWSK